MKRIGRHLSVILVIGLMVGCATKMTEEQWKEYFSEISSIKICMSYTSQFRLGKAHPRVLKELENRNIDCEKVLNPDPDTLKGSSTLSLPRRP